MTFHALGVGSRWDDALVFNGAIHVIGAAFSLMPGQPGARAGVQAQPAATLAAPAAVGLTPALGRHRRVIVAVAGVTLPRIVSGHHAVAKDRP